MYNKVYMDIAERMARETKCLARQVGCVIVRERMVVATGYNGPPSGLEHCFDAFGGCMRRVKGVEHGRDKHLCRALHAEQNALLQCAMKGTDPRCSDIYCTSMPCSTCAKMLIQVRAKVIYFGDDFDDGMNHRLFEEAGILVRDVKTF